VKASDRPLRILHVDSERSWRGGQQQILFLLRRQRDGGDRPVLAAPKGSPLAARASAENIPVHALPMRGTWDVGTVLGLARLHRALRPDVVHWHAARAHALGALAALLTPVPARVLSRRVVFPVRRSIGSRILYTLPVDRIAAISQAVRDALVQSGVDGARIRVVPSGIDRSLFERPFERGPLRASLGATDSDTVALCAASLVPAKGVDELLRAAALASPRAPTLRLWIAGEGPEASALERLAWELRPAPVVRFLGFREDVQDLLRAADFFCLATRAEGLGSSMLEAMAAGLPVAATRTGGIPEIVSDGETGILVPSGDTAALGEALARLTQDESLRRSLGARAKARARAFDADRTARVTRELYLEALTL